MTDLERIEVFRKVLIGEAPAGPCALIGIMETLVLYSAMPQEDLEALAKKSTERRFVAILCRRCRSDFFGIDPEQRFRICCHRCTVFQARKRLGSKCTGRPDYLGPPYVGWRLKP